MKTLVTIVLISFSFLSVAKAEVDKIDPPFWWTNMPVERLQLQIYGKNMGKYHASIDYHGVKIAKQIQVDSPNYLFLYLEISPEAKPGLMNIYLKNGRENTTVEYHLLQRDPLEGKNQGFNSGDLIYLIMPDRFANGDSSNDSIEGMLESVNRDDPTKRQGGDITGIMDHLDYIRDLGMTAIWINPIFENDMPPEYGGYHGYAATDLYKVDRRLGSNEDYKNLVYAAHSKGMKVVMDLINNHIGDQHWWMKDLPTKDWVHDFDKIGQTNYRGEVASDPYSSKYDSDRLFKGWFVAEMPDLNQHNELLADYLIQNTIWWIEYSGIDGIRMDTYFFSYIDYMSRWAKEVLDAYPNFNIVGESWVEGVTAEAFWQYDKPSVDDGYNSNLPSVTDFQFCYAARDALKEPFGRSAGVSKLYHLFSQDSAYADPMLNVIFLDNHDMARIYEHLDQNESHFKMLYTFLITARGIPVVYYGTELMMGHENRGGDDEAWRQTMPGGWPGDSRSIFTKEGRTVKENEIIDFVGDLGKWRQTSDAARFGRLLHFVPENGVYVYFRIHENQTLMVIMNSNEQSVAIDTNRFKEVTNKFRMATDIVTGKTQNIKNGLKVSGKFTSILELLK